MDLKLGKLPATHDSRDLQMAHYTADLAKAPTWDTDNLNQQITWGMLGNDRAGDCVFAGGDHESMLWTVLGGVHVGFSDSTALADYSAVTGYKPADPSTDRGTDVRNALSYRQKTGLADTTGKRHKLGAYAALEPGNHEHVKDAIHLFDCVGIGIEFPVTAMDQFNRGKPWTVVHGATVEGGHYIPLIGYTLREVFCVTWGKVQPMSWGFFGKYCDEAWALLSAEYLAFGRSPDGFDMATLKSDLAALKA